MDYGLCEVLFLFTYGPVLLLYEGHFQFLFVCLRGIVLNYFFFFGVLLILLLFFLLGYFYLALQNACIYHFEISIKLLALTCYYGA